MILIFDLDDTLYPEEQFVRSGLQAVAAHLNNRFNWPADECLQRMLQTLKTKGRGRVFDELLSHHGCLTKVLVRDCLKVYRYHRPRIKLAPAARRLLNSLDEKPYLVTDGHKHVQNSKIAALGIKCKFKKCYITHRYGICNSKPSIYCFELIRKQERCEWSDMCYIGDNPAKDFVNLNKIGVNTVRVLSGVYSNVNAKPGYEAVIKISSLDQLQKVLKDRGW